LRQRRLVSFVDPSRAFLVGGSALGDSQATHRGVERNPYHPRRRGEPASFRTFRTDLHGFQEQVGEICATTARRAGVELVPAATQSVAEPKGVSLSNPEGDFGKDCTMLVSS
jgi:hypothetical protein